ncbi:RND family efflux transporter MFP subunit [Pelomonas aquatica]|uniref:RND family efflux transporter MFP subunit n=1 Tax=Pelomonas aquatica TaxID=431058 RepID=A0ABU1ZCI2_9BURK|nr:efflux RND transporter periplasmic adaptor subunit [Pelomonas aquatica]MDR7298339.1 RND family efflux transporter MFP subunit [Pelomonas aquatica]
MKLNKPSLPTLASATLLLALAAASLLALQPADAADDTAKAGAPKPALSVAAVQARSESWPQTLAANGSLAAWREVQVGTEASGQRIEQVLVDIGQRVKKGQLLAQLAAASLSAELAASKASLLEAQASAQDAAATAARLKSLAGSDAVSAQQVEQAQAADAAARARVAALQARVKADELRLSHTRVVAPVDGVVATKEAVEGALPQPGQTLFTLIRDGRLEWRAEVPGADLGRLAVGQKVRITPAGGQALDGRVRLVAPTVDPANRMGRVLVDVPAHGTARAGMFARGEFVLGEAPVLTLPQSALLLRDGFAYVFRVEGSKVRQAKVETGRRQGDRVEVKAGLKAGEPVVTQGVGFLADGDTVRVVAAPAGAASGVAK